MLKFRALLGAAFLASAPLAAVAQSITCGQTYTVAPGDTLSRISTQAYGVSAFDVLIEANKDALGGNPDLLFVGQQLNIPCRSDTVAQPTAPVADPNDTAVTQDAPTPAPDPDATPSGPVVLTFNRASDPRFVINSGIVDPFLQQIERLTEGRVQFVDPATVNTNASAQFDLVTSGQVDGAYVFNPFLADSHPLLQIPMIPLMGGSAQQTAVSLWNLHETYLSDTNYFDDAHLLGFIAAPTAHIWHGQDDPVQVGDNLAAQNDYPVPYFDGLDTIGPKRVQDLNAIRFSPEAETATGPFRFLMAHGAARGGGIWNDMRAVTEFENGIYTPTFSLILSNEAWARISPKDQETITILSGRALAQRSAAWDDFDNGHRRIMLDTGLEVRYPDGPLLREVERAAQLGLARWARAAEQLAIPTQQAIASYRADLASLRYLLIFR